MVFAVIADLEMDSIANFSEQAFGHSLRPFFKQHGFEYLPELKQFRKLYNHGYQNVVIAPQSATGAVHFQVTFGTRFHMVERCLDFFEGHHKYGYIYRNTTLTSLHRYLEVSNFKLTAETAEGLRRAHQYIESFFVKSGFDFLDQLTNLDLVERAYNESPLADSPLVLNQELRCFRGLIMAYLTQNRDLEELHDRYIERLIQMNAPADRLHRFSDLFDYLRNFGLN